MRKLTEAEIMQAVRDAKMSQKQIDAMTYTQWKDGIDLQVPTVELVALANALTSHWRVANDRTKRTPAPRPLDRGTGH